MSDLALPLFSYLGWSFLPNLATQFLQSLYYRVTVSAGQPHPQPGTPLYFRDHKRIRIAVLTLYLLYTLTQSLYDIKVAGDFYTLLAVSPYTTSSKQIRSQLRRLAARYHPDKQPSSSNEQIFLQLRLAGETLTTPSHRYAYTHFGPQILTHLPKPSSEESSSPRHSSLETATLITLALKQKIPSYLVTLVFIFTLNTFFLPAKSSGKYWRYLILSASFVLEFYLLTHDTPALPGIVSTAISFLRQHTKLGDVLPPHLLPFQILQISNSLAISLNIFISQIGALFPASHPDGNDAQQMRSWMSQLNANLTNLSAISTRIDSEATGLLQLQLAPYKGQPTAVRELRRGMKEGMVMGSVKGHPEVRQAVRRVVDRRRLEREAQEGTAREDGTEVVDLLNSDEQFI